MKEKPSDIFKELFGEEITKNLKVEDISNDICMVTSQDGRSFPFEVRG